MGLIIRQKAELVRPSQRRICIEGLAGLLQFFKEGRHGELFPPAVRTFPDFMAIDGHHRLFLADLFDLELDMYCVEREGDLMRRDEFPQYDGHFLWETNIVVAFNYDKIPRCVGSLEKGGIVTFEDMRHYYNIHNVDDLERLIRWQCPGKAGSSYVCASGSR